MRQQAVSLLYSAAAAAVLALEEIVLRRNTIVIITSEMPLFARTPTILLFFSSLSLLSFSFLATERGSHIGIGRKTEVEFVGVE